MDIRKDQFAVEAVRLLQDIADSHFIAFDFEFSGIAERNRDRASKQTIEERYEETRASVQEYQPLQIGLTIAKFDEQRDRYVLEPYNLNISPLPLLRERRFTRKWSMNSGAVSFLHRNGFDFGRQLIHGVPYLSVQEEELARTKMKADSIRQDMILKPDDQILATHIRDTVTEWQSQPKDLQEEYVNIPNGNPAGIPEELNSYQRRLVHQIVQNEFPSMKTQSMGHFIQITNPTSDQQASRKALEEEQRERDLARAIGFRWIVDGIIGKDLSNLPHDYLLPALPPSTPAADGEKPVKALLETLNTKLRQRHKVLIGHNCMVDIMFLYKLTIGDLPQTLQDFTTKVHDLFPAIIDTKFLSSSFSEKHGRLALGEVMENLNFDTTALPEIYTSPEFSRYTENAYLHEAGYDSYITAIVAIKMAAKLQRDGSARKKDHDNQQAAVAESAAKSPPEFGKEVGYVPTIETMADGSSTNHTENISSAQDPDIPTPTPPQPQPQNEQTPTKPTFTEDPIGKITSKLSNLSSALSNITSTQSSSTSPDTTATDKTNQTSPTPVGHKEEDDTTTLRSAFASTSIYDTLSTSNSSTMPGDQHQEPDTPQPAEAPETPEERMNRLVKEGRLMPPWTEESGFWRAYGNRLQVNGTVEGVLKVVE